MSQDVPVAMIVTMKIFGRIVLLRNSTPVSQIADTADRHRCIFTFSPICMYSKLREEKIPFSILFFEQKTFYLQIILEASASFFSCQVCLIEFTKSCLLVCVCGAGAVLDFHWGRGKCLIFWLSH